MHHTENHRFVGYYSVVSLKSLDERSDLRFTDVREGLRTIWFDQA